MTPAEVHEVFAKVTYKPNFRLALHRHPTEPSWEFRVAAQVTDARGFYPTPIQLAARYQLAEDRMAYWDRERLFEWLESCLLKFETHEVREWLKFDGKCVQNPHPAPVS